MAENGASAKRTSSDPGDVSAPPEGVPCWVDAQLSDVEAGKRFYGGLFGWTFREFDEDTAEDTAEGAEGGTVWAWLDGAPVAALARKTDGRMPTVWSVYFHTPDAAALAERIRAAGGQVVTPPHPVGGLGTTALAADPEGAVFALWQPARHPGFGRRHEPGTFAWVELYTRDTEAANAFYGDLFRDALFGPDAAPDFGRAPVLDVFPAEMPPHFLVHFRVEDCEAALGTVARLGGRVRVPPFETSYGRVAVVSDGQGASFALLQR
ncbi:VOC family protein [Streptomyces sp. DH41]|uniref:VOC family protein n=1 Tax=Streptomyces sp. DH41 TaxID=3040125 RepID=UPI0024415689|nr:VOC family protein [Streptomyces sp. DH41]MDG9727685.1 VOC family protein [Streptomyces sp. DH41]